MVRRKIQNGDDVFIDADDLSLGLYALEDTTKAPFGSARIMKNCIITERGGIAPREGTKLLGSDNSDGDGVKGLYNFKKSVGQNEILLKGIGTKLQAYSRNHSDAGWFTIKDNFTDQKEFGFVTSLVNTENEDYTIFCNRYDNYMRWSGAITQLNGALSGGETSIVVDSVLTDEIYVSETATGNSATTVTVSNANWADDQWNGLYIYFPSTGKVREITDTTSDTLTFDTLGSGPGNIAFQVRKLAFPETGTLIYNGTEIAYTGIDVATAFTVVSAHAAPDNTPVTIIPTEYPENPRGNRFANFLARIVVGNIRSALARNSGGALSGFAVAGSVFVSKQKDPVDFTYQATRVAGEGDVIGTPYGGGDVTDVIEQENVFYIFKNRYIEAVSYSQDANDLAIRDPLKQGVGSVGPVIKGPDDVYFVTPDNEITSIGRTKTKDLRPETENIGLVIKRLLLNYVFGTGRGAYFKDRLFIPAKSSSEETNNNIVIVYNKEKKAFEGIWDLSAHTITEFEDKLCYGESNGNNVYEMFVGNADVVGTNRFAINSEYASHFFNLTRSNGSFQELNSLYFEGYIRTNTTVTFNVWKDFASDPFLTFDFSGDESSLTEGTILSAFLGGEPFGLSALGAVGEAESDGRRPFYFRVYFPFQYGRYFAHGFNFNELDGDFELTRVGFGIKESVGVDNNKVKSI